MSAGSDVLGSANDALQDVGDLLNTARLIVQSNPDALNRFAGRWQDIATAVRGQQTTVVNAIVATEFDSDGALAKRMTSYRLQVGNGMEALASGAESVAGALRGIAPKLSGIRTDLYVALIGIGLAVAGTVVSGGLGGFLAGADVLTLVNLVGNYRAAMTELATSLNEAQTRLEALKQLNGNGGIIPTAPPVPPANAPSAQH